MTTSALEKARHRGGPVSWVASLVIGFLLLACLSNEAPGQTVNGAQRGLNKATGMTSVSDRKAPVAPATPAVLQVFPTNRAVNVLPNAVALVRPSSGKLRTVTLVDSQHRIIDGQIRPDGTWRTSELLRPASKYIFRIAATGPGGAATSTTSSFTTLRPKVTATYSVLPGDATVGVGMPVSIQFDSEVSTKARRAEVEKRVEVRTIPIQAGAWGWLDNRQLMWRPRTYWLPGTKVTVSAALHGLPTGRSKWITDDNRTSFTVGRSMVSSVNMRKHTLIVRRNGVVIRSFPVSTGKPGPLTETRQGIKVIIERDSAIVMDSATIGIPKGSPGYYRIPTQWNLRLTWTGEFIHSAPWSVGSQGTQNVSHGCTNMAPANAEWMFKNSKAGDVVIYTGSHRTFEPTDGIGVWVYNYAGWKARSALA